MSSLSQGSLVQLGKNVHKDSISMGILRPDDSMGFERIFQDEESVRKFIARMGEPRQLVACYEAGPTGYGLERLLRRLGTRRPGEDRPAGRPAADPPGPGPRPLQGSKEEMFLPPSAEQKNRRTSSAAHLTGRSTTVCPPDLCDQR